MNDPISNLPLQARLLSPLHIGSYQQALEKTEYFVQQRRVYVADSDEVFQNIITEQDRQNWLSGGARTSLTRIYQNYQAARRPRLDSAKLALYNLTANSELDGESQYRPFQRNGRGKPYIAGSSLKGALRNGWLYHYLDSHPDKLQTLAGRLKQTLRNVQPKDLKKELDRLLGDNYFREGFFGQTQSPNEGGVNADAFRIIGVSDSPPLDDRQLAVEDIRVLCDLDNLNDRDGNLVLYEKTRLIAECLQERQNFQFSLSYNHILAGQYRGFSKKLDEYKPDELTDFPLSLEVLLDKADAFFRKVWDYEARFFTGPANDRYRSEPGDRTAPQIANFYKETNLPEAGQGWLLRVGAGSGLHSVTPDLVLRATKQQPDRSWLRDTLNDDSYSLMFLMGYHNFWREQLKALGFPKSRKIIWRENGPRKDYAYPLGWLLITKNQPEQE